jgi:hypothetical protein
MMRGMRTARLLVACLLALFVMSETAHAVPREPQNHWKYLSSTATGVATAALNGSPSFTVSDARGYSVMTVQVDLTRTNATTLVLTCTGNLDGSTTTFGSLPSGSPSSGAVTQYALVFTWPSVSGSGRFLFSSIPINYHALQCVLTGASSTANDKVTAAVFLGVI